MDLLKKAQKAIINLFSNTDVELETTLEYLKELQEDIDYRIDAIEQALKPI